MTVSTWVKIAAVCAFTVVAHQVFASEEALNLLLANPVQSDWQQVIDLTHRNDSKSLAVIALIICQVLFILSRTMLGEILGVYRLLVLAILSLLVTIGANLMSGKTWVESLLFDAGTLFAYQVAFHQIKRQWEKRRDDQETLKRSSGVCSFRVRKWWLKK